jgi:hypothetical protein
MPDAQLTENILQSLTAGALNRRDVRADVRRPRPDLRRDAGHQFTQSDFMMLDAGLTVIQWQSGVPVAIYPPDLAIAAPFWPKR